jgi:hypothetical protein
MQYFEDRQDVEEWLEPLGYDDFWREVSTFPLTMLQSRESCDEQIARGDVDEETVLYVLKGIVRLEIVQQQNLKPRDTVPWMSMH